MWWLVFSTYSVMLLKFCCVFLVVFGIDYPLYFEIKIFYGFFKKLYCTSHLCVKMVFLSEERVSFGELPVCSRSTRILFLTNVSRTDRVLYSWKLKEQDGKQVCEMGAAYIYNLHLLP